MAVLKLPRMPDGAAIVDTKNGKPITALTRAWDAAMSQIEDNLNGILAAQDAADAAQSDADAAMAAAMAAQADADAAMAAAIAAQATADAAKATADALDAALNVTAGKVLTVLNTMTLAAIDGSTLNIGTGGTLGTAAFTNASDYLPSGASGSFLAKASNLSDVASVPTARSNLGLGTAATQNTGTSGANVPLLNSANTWGATQVFNGAVLVGNTAQIAGESLQARQTAAAGIAAYFTNSAAVPTSAIHWLNFSASAPNNTAAVFWICNDTGGFRAYLNSNGGLSNYSANNVNLSDATVKGAVERYSETDLDALERSFLKVNWGRFKYLDQTHTDWNHGYTAQGVETAFAGVAPELVDETEIGTKGDGVKRKGVYETDLTHIGLALLARGLKRIEAMESKMYAAGIT